MIKIDEIKNRYQRGTVIEIPQHIRVNLLIQEKFSEDIGNAWQPGPEGARKDFNSIYSNKAEEREVLIGYTNLKAVSAPLTQEVKDLFLIMPENPEDDAQWREKQNEWIKRHTVQYSTMSLAGRYVITDWMPYTGGMGDFRAGPSDFNFQGTINAIKLADDGSFNPEGVALSTTPHNAQRTAYCGTHGFAAGFFISIK